MLVPVQVSVAVLLDNFITAASRINFNERLQAAERRQREQVLHGQIALR